MLHIIMYARVVELVDTLVLGTSASRREGSSPFSRTKKLYKNRSFYKGGFLIIFLQISAPWWDCFWLGVLR